jgi:hypothetical protein
MSDIHEGLLRESTPKANTEPGYFELICDSLPVTLGLSLEIFIMTINLHYAYGPIMTAGLGLSMILIHSLGGSLIMGFNAGFCNFASRAFGAKNRTSFNKFLMKGFVNQNVLFTLFIMLGFASEVLSIMAGQDPQVSRYARQFYVYQLPGFFCLFTGDFLRSYLNSQSIYSPLVSINVITIAIHLVFSWLISSKYGMTGIIISTNLTMASYLLMMIYVEKKYSTWKITL